MVSSESLVALDLSDSSLKITKAPSFPFVYFLSYVVYLMKYKLFYNASAWRGTLIYFNLEVEKYFFLI
jgi:hypothetical protein